LNWELLALLLLFGGIGFAVGWLIASWRARHGYEKRLFADARKIAELESTLAQKESALLQVSAQLRDQFAAASREALQQNRDEFLALAEKTLRVVLEQARGDVQQTTTNLQQLLKPLQETLNQYQQTVQQLESKLAKDYGALSTTSEDIKKELVGLRQTAQGLTLALAGDIRARGNWGQLQLERVAELAGLKKGIDYDLQVTTDAGRPDMVVYLPGNRCIAVDAKAPAIEVSEISTPDREKTVAEKYGNALAARIKDLSRKEYWETVGNSLDLVILFIGAEGPLALAVESNRNLIDDALKQNVLIATPASLYAVFKAIASTWKSHRATEGVKKIIEAGRDLCERLGSFAEHLKDVGSGLKRAVEAYNKAVGSFDARLVPGARKLHELGAGDAKRRPDDLEVPSVEELPRSPHSAPPLD
jgi:DNA recombination protein RmuC